ncbi:PilN domain-containing protein [Paraneptunicella aestuarii]|uniref:PilN domain-containing protein n=1 Tax=Paraneptunicella aestuarii TaxID=2831148 RepID=UPI001E5C9064|nr:PilN domain-containing protein [Paraneptunicella aestuarii]UAA39084.1 PilN domain-containing protein [Paraneptunicella aestuarii]
MKYRVNLFPQELKPKLQLMTLNFMLFIWGVSILVMFIFAEHFQERYLATQKRTQTIQTDYNTKKTLLETLTKARDNRAQDPVLLESVKRLQDEERAKYLLLSELKGREQMKNQGFSVLMKDLAENHIPDIWLTRISISEQKIWIEGGALKSEKVPVWVSQLRESDYFRGRDFAGARMFRNEQDELSFVISSDLSELVLQEGQAVQGEVQ